MEREDLHTHLRDPGQWDSPRHLHPRTGRPEGPIDSVPILMSIGQRLEPGPSDDDQSDRDGQRTGPDRATCVSAAASVDD